MPGPIERTVANCQNAEGLYTAFADLTTNRSTNAGTLKVVRDGDSVSLKCTRNHFYSRSIDSMDQYEVKKLDDLLEYMVDKLMDESCERLCKGKPENADCIRRAIKTAKDDLHARIYARFQHDPEKFRPLSRENIAAILGTVDRYRNADVQSVIDDGIKLGQSDAPAAATRSDDVDALTANLTKEQAGSIIMAYAKFAKDHPGQSVRIRGFSELAEGKVELEESQGDEHWIGRDLSAQERNDQSRKILRAAVRQYLGKTEIPQAVAEEMPEFGLSGHGELAGRPLSSSRISKILTAVYANDDIAALGDRLKQSGPSLSKDQWQKAFLKLNRMEGEVGGVAFKDLGKFVHDALAGIDKIRSVSVQTLISEMQNDKGPRQNLEALRTCVSDLAEITGPLSKAIAELGADEDFNVVIDEAAELQADLVWFQSEVERLGSRELAKEIQGPSDGMKEEKGLGKREEDDIFRGMKFGDVLDAKPVAANADQVTKAMRGVQRAILMLQTENLPDTEESRKAAIEKIGKVTDKINGLVIALDANRNELSPRNALLFRRQTTLALDLLESLRRAVEKDVTNKTAFINDLCVRLFGENAKGKTLADLVKAALEVDAEAFCDLRRAGYESDEIALDFSERTKFSKSFLGNGAMNEVFQSTGGGVVGEGRLVVTKDGTRVNEEAKEGILSITAGCGVDAVNSNLASNLAQKLLGVDVVVRTEVAAPKNSGQAPTIVMEKAPGKSMKTIADKKTEIDEFSDRDTLRCLLWKAGSMDYLDWMTGQCDRHINNANLEVLPKTSVDTKFNGRVTLKAFDNDMSFPEFRIGLRKFRYTEEQKDAAIAKIRDNLSNALKKKEIKEGEAVLPDDLFKKVVDGDKVWYEVEIQPSRKIGEKVGTNIALSFYGFGLTSVRKPSYVPDTVLEKLKILKADVAVWKKQQTGSYSTDLQRLQKKLTETQFDAMMLRIDEMIAHVEDLERDGLVLNTSTGDGMEKIFKKMVENAKNDMYQSMFVDSAACFLHECDVIEKIEQKLDKYTKAREEGFFE